MLAGECYAVAPVRPKSETSRVLRPWVPSGSGQPHVRQGNSSGGAAIVTYVASKKQSYVDGAVMLGRSLAGVAQGVELVCLVQEDLNETQKSQLDFAGWHIWETKPWVPERLTKKKHPSTWGPTFNKADIFLLPFEKVLYLDSDVLMLGTQADLDYVLQTPLKPGYVKAVHDISLFSGYNSGMMVLAPSRDAFRRFTALANQHGKNDQPVINELYRGKFVSLPFRYNLHGYGKHNCTDVVFAHYTGGRKPAEADASHLRKVRDGRYSDKYSLSCPELYRKYFSMLHEQQRYLSPDLQKLLTEPGLQPLL